MTASASPPGRVAFVVKGYPRLSETFIAQEILALEQRGLDILIVSLRHPTDRVSHPVHREIRAPVLYLPEYLHDEPARLLRGWRRACRLPGYRAAWRGWLADLARDPTPNRVRRFGQALVLAAELPADIGQLHAHFLHTPASVARYAAAIRGLDWSVSAHAKDLWTIPAWEKREKLAAARWAVTCTEHGRHHLADLAPSPDRVALSYHGLDLDRFPPAPRRPAGGDGSDAAWPVTVLSVGRAVEKKGYDDLLAALALLPAGLAWRLVHIGGGALAEKLKREAAQLGLAAKVARDGDRDGLPNVLIEAQSQGLACVTTRLPGIAELIEDNQSGILVPPAEPRALAAALERLIRAPALRQRLGQAGEARVRGYFDMRAGIGLLAQRFGLRAHQPPPAPRERVADAERRPGEGISRPIHPHPAAALAAATLSRGAGEG
jgi:glycosyltransferase involved in cell wall biosynthesis